VGLDTFCSGWGPVTASCEHGVESSVPQKAKNFLTSRATIKFSRTALLHGVRYNICLHFKQTLNVTIL
jgi:hypothetical protein